MEFFNSLICVFLAITSMILQGHAANAQDIPTVYPIDPFDPVNDANRLDDAMSGFGTNEDKIIDTLCHRTGFQRRTITNTYNSMHGSLINDLESELSGNFRILAVWLTYDMHEFMAIHLHKTMAQLGTDEESLTEVLISRSNAELANIRTFFSDFYGVPLVGMIQTETSGATLDLMTFLAEGSRDEGVDVDPIIVTADATALYEAGEGQTGTNEQVFVDIFAHRNWAHMNAIYVEYAATYGNPLDVVISAEFSMSIRDALLAIYKYSTARSTYFAERLRHTVEVTGTLDNDLMRLVVSRCEIDLGNIKAEYERIYGQSLASDIDSDTSGSYRTALLALVG